jgi:ferric-dicitrate binding protein FerR (iron transport regulator)
MRACLRCNAIPGWEAMAETRIKPYLEQQAEEARRAEQRRQFRRNQVFGLVILAAAICAWWLFHTNPKWIFPPGWWRW